MGNIVIHSENIVLRFRRFIATTWFSGQKVLAVVALLSLLPLAQADHLQPHSVDNPRGWQGPLLSTYLGVGLGFGGEEVGRFTDRNGYTEKVRSGGGVLLEGGLNLAMDSVTNLRITGGYQFDIASRASSSALFDRLRFDITLLKRVGMQEFGGGFTAHTSVGYRCDINSICSADTEFDHALGYTLEYAINTAAYRNGSGLRIGLRYTGIDYRTRAPDTAVSDGDSLSGFVGVVF